MNRLLISKPNDASSAPEKITVAASAGRFHKGLKFFQQHCYTPIDVGDLAKASKMSRRGWHKAFEKHVGQSPGRELRRRRIERAKQLLAGSAYNLAAIAKMCGYRNANSFWVSFRRMVGESPGKFRSAFFRAAK